MLGHLRLALIRPQSRIVNAVTSHHRNILGRRIFCSEVTGTGAIEPLSVQLVTTSIESPLTATAAMKKKILSVALIGRPNTGKSTLFNRLTSSNLAIVSPVAGTTRDRKMEKGYIAGLPLIVMDTGGLDDRGMINVQIQEQVHQALATADVVIFMLDAQTGVTSLDEHFAQWIRKKLGQIDRIETDRLKKAEEKASERRLRLGSGSEEIVVPEVRHAKELILLANKTEGAHLSDKVLDCISEALRLGLGDPLPISAAHGDGMAELAQMLIEIAKRRGFEDGEEISGLAKRGPIKLEERTIQLAVMGRPNVGKSSLINAFIGADRMIVGEMPGLTRDAIHVEWAHKERHFKLVDTAGLTRIRTDKTLLAGTTEKKKMRLEATIGRNVRVSRRSGSNTYSAVELPGIALMNPEEDPSQFSHQVSELSLVSAMNALRFAQVVLLVVENSQGKFSKLDLQIARKCLEEGRALVIAANKGDLAAVIGVGPRDYEDGVRKHCEAFMRELGDVPVIACVAIEKRGINRVLDTVIRVHDAWSTRISTWILNKWLKDTLVTTPPPRVSGKKLAIKYIVQIKSRPPTFALFCNTKELPGFFERFLRNRIQQDFKLDGIPIRFFIRKSKGSAVEMSLLKSGSARTTRGKGNGYARMVGPGRKNGFEIQKLRKRRDVMRRRSSQLKAMRTPKRKGGKLPPIRQNKR